MQSNSTDSCQQLLSHMQPEECQSVGKKTSRGFNPLSYFLGDSFPLLITSPPWHQLPKRIWLLILTSLSRLQLPPQLAGISRQLKIFTRFMKTCIKKSKHKHKCYTFSKVMPASQSWQAVLAVWNVREKQHLKISLSINEATLPPSDSFSDDSGTGDFSKY